MSKPEILIRNLEEHDIAVIAAKPSAWLSAGIIYRIGAD